MQPGLYVLGLINQSAAKKAGIGQGDQILEVDGLEMKEQSHFEAAALIQSSADGSNKPSVEIKVILILLFASPVPHTSS